VNPRRQFALGLCGGLVCAPLLLRAQASGSQVRRVGVLAPSTAAREEVTLKPFFEQMRQLGWIEGQNIVYDRAYADDQQQLLGRLAAELVARKPDLIYAPPTPAALAAKQATNTIPIVFGAVWDPVGTGLVSSLPRPGGNVTGISVFAESLAPKRMQLLREVLPSAKRIGWLGDATDQATKLEYQAYLPMAAAQGLTVVFAEAANPAAVEAAMARLMAERVEAIYSGTSPLLYNMRERLIELATKRRVPVIAYRAQFADAGALFAFGASLSDQLRRSAFFADKILRGAKPGDLPVEQATLFELVVNLRVAKALGIAIPQSFLLRAERVIE
jgi:putative ABC transport system substrate-binding protein